MKRTIRLTENDLNRIVYQVINEDIYNNDIYDGVMNVLRNSIATKEEKIEVLKYILDDMEKSSEIRRRYQKRNKHR